MVNKIRFWTPKRVNELKEILKKVDTYEQAGKQFGVSRAAISSVVRQHKIKVSGFKPGVNQYSKDSERAKLKGISCIICEKPIVHGCNHCIDHLSQTILLPKRPTTWKK